MNVSFYQLVLSACIFLHPILSKVTLSQEVSFHIFNNLSPEIERELSDKPFKIVGILTLPISKVLKSKIRDHIARMKSEDLNTQEYPEIDDIEHFDKSSFFASSYAKWLKSHGIQIIPIDIYTPISELEGLLNSIDGMLFTGGAVPLIRHDTHIEVDSKINMDQNAREMSFYTQKVKEIVKIIKDINDSGRVFPLWTTCLGFEGLILGESNLELPLKDVDNSNSNSSVNFNSEHKEKSTFMNFFSEEELKFMQESNVFFFNHEHAFSEKEFNANKVLSSEYRVIATSKVKNSPQSKIAPFEDPIVAIIEHYNYPFYGVQFHPEKNEFETRVGADGSPMALSILRRFSEFFCDKLNGNHNRENLEVIDKKLSKYEFFTGTNIGVFDEVYIFKPNN